MQKGKGILFVLSGPSGVGKGTVCTALREQNQKLIYSVSATSREPRPGEVDGVNYFFKSLQEFETMIEEDQFLEWAKYVGNYYGTPRSFVDEMIEQGKDVILEIEVQGAMQVKEKYPEGVFIFLAPPTLDDLRSRISDRGTEAEEVIEHRLKMARTELEMMQQYDYIVVNDEVEHAAQRIAAIIVAENCRQDRRINQYTHLF